jgi:DNA-binding LacI/PurR family transcriptional regulator
MPKHTIYDIARLAGVSGKTVSRVLSNEPGVKPQTRARVEHLIEKVVYRPHHGAEACAATGGTA